MIYLKKTETAPVSLAVERLKASGSYREKDVLDQLETDFHNKCYICEAKDLTCINIEHFIPHENDIELKFDWENLFWSCAHCNNTKLAKYNNLLNCTKSSDNVDDSIRYVYFPYRDLLVEALNPNDEKAVQTAKLIEDIYNGVTDLKRIEAVSLNKHIHKAMWELFDLIDEYEEVIDEDDKQLLKIKLKRCLSRASSFTAIKRWYIKESPNLQEFIILFD